MWKQAIHFPGYEVSDSGEVRNAKTKHVFCDACYDKYVQCEED